MLTFTTPIGGFFSGVTDKLQGIGTGDIWDLGEYGGGSGGGGSGVEQPGDENNELVPGLYQTGTETLIAAWDELLADGSIVVINGAVSISTVLPDSLPAKNEYGFYYDVTYNAFGVGVQFFEDGSLEMFQNGASAGVAPAGSATYSAGSVDLSALDMGTGSFSPDGSSMSLLGYTFAIGESAQLAGDLVLPDDGTITAIGDYDVDSCTGKPAFSSCTSLTSITIPDSVTSIGDHAFIGCTNLTSINIPDGVTSIGKYAFSSCSGLTSITIPDGVTSISQGAFAWCTNLTSIEIPASVTSICKDAFTDCTSLTSITFEGAAVEWNAINKDYYWKISVPATEVVCSDGNVSLS